MKTKDVTVSVIPTSQTEKAIIKLVSIHKLKRYLFGNKTKESIMLD